MRLCGRVGITKRSMARKFHVLMTLLGLKVNEENVKTFKHYWESRKRSDATLTTDTVTLYKSDHQLYLMALCGVIKKYSAPKAYFPAPHEIEIILPFVLQLVNTTASDGKKAIQYFKTGVYQSLFGYDKSKCNLNSYELTDDWHIPGKTESGKPAFYLVCIYLFMVAMNVRAESAASIEKAIKVKITDRLPIPLSFSKLFEKDVFKQSRTFFVNVFEKKSQKVVEYRGQSRFLAAHLEKKFSEVAAFCVTLYTDDTYTDLMKAPDFTPDPEPFDTFKESTDDDLFSKKGTYNDTMESKLYPLIYTYGQILRSGSDIYTTVVPFTNSIKYLLCAVINTGEPNARSTTWTMKFHGHPKITYTVPMEDVVQDLVDKVKGANSVFEVKQLFSKENVCNILRKKASTADGKFKLTFSGSDAEKKKLRWYCETLMSQHITLNTTNAANPWLYPSLLLTDVYNQLARTDAATEAPFFDSSFFKPSIFGTSAE